MPQELVLPPMQTKVLSLLQQKAGEIVSYAELNAVISCRDNRNHLATSIYRLRKRGLRIQNHSGVGYRLKQRNKPVEVLDLDEENQAYADEVQDAIHSIMRRHADVVGFESQVAIIGVAIGAILHQLPPLDRKHFTRVFIKNMEEAPKFSTVIVLN
jgi:biotin operon repressor